jgi:cation:H+ antiporter
MNTTFLIIGGLVCLAVGGEMLVRGASRLATIFGIPSIIIGLTIVAFGTSTPELAVSVDAALGGNANIALSNVVGSNIFNILFILGVSSLILPLMVHAQVIKREAPIMLLVALILYGLALNGVISRMEGVLLFLGIIAYSIWLVMEAVRNKSANEGLAKQSEEAFGLHDKKIRTMGISIGFVVIGLGVVMLGADWMVEGAVQLAKQLGISDTVIGLTIVAAGTSLPEVVASLIATIKGERDIAIGNVVGSNIYNVLAIVGISASLAPGGLSVSEELLRFDFLFMLAVTAVACVFLWTGKTLSRWEGVAFLLSYALYTGYLVVQAGAG